MLLGSCKARSEQRYRIFFFRGHGRWSFIHSNPKIVFFFFRGAGKKKIQLVFFYFRGKVDRSFIPILMRSPFFNISWLCFFFSRIFGCLCVFFFPRKSSHVIHSFDLRAVFFFLASGKKKQHFHSFIQFFTKSAQKRTFPGKKNTVPLLPPSPRPRKDAVPVSAMSTHLMSRDSNKKLTP